MQNWESLKKFFNGSNENLLRNSIKNVVDEHLTHYELRIGEILNNNKVKRILDVGCGEGKVLSSFAKRYPEIEFIGIDISSQNIKTAKKDFSLENTSYYNLNIIDGFQGLGKFDLIFSFSLIQYFDHISSINLSKSLQFILNPNGFIVHMSIPDIRYRKKHLKPKNFSFLNYTLFLARLILILIKKKKNYDKNSFWWDAKILKKHYEGPDTSVEILPSDSWYRFDLIFKSIEK